MGYFILLAVSSITFADWQGDISAGIFLFTLGFALAFVGTEFVDRLVEHKNED